jgi:hypothetical protein
MELLVLAVVAVQLLMAAAPPALAVLEEGE